MASKTLNIFMCNAGIFEVQPGLTEDGYGLLFGINVLDGEKERALKPGVLYAGWVGSAFRVVVLLGY
jgi:hypothetical protein